jgi:hypothetical protein
LLTSFPAELMNRPSDGAPAWVLNGVVPLDTSFRLKYSSFAWSSHFDSCDAYVDSRRTVGE